MSPATSDHTPPADDDAGRNDIGQPDADRSPVPATSASASGAAGAEASGPPRWLGPYPVSWTPVPDRAPRRPGPAFAAGAAAVLVITLLGAPLGLIWSAVAPQVPVVRTEDGAVLAQPQPEQFIAADGWFSLLGLGFGLLAAVAVWLILRRYRGPVGMAVVALGAVGAALLAWRLGRQIGLAEYQHLLNTAPVGKMFNKPPDLRAGRFDWRFPLLHGDLLLPAFGAVVTYTLLAGWSRHPTLQPEPEPAPVSWDSTAPPAPGSAPAPPAPGEAAPPRD